MLYFSNKITQLPHEPYYCDHHNTIIDRLFLLTDKTPLRLL